MTQNGTGGSGKMTLYSAVVAKGAPASPDKLPSEPSSDLMKLKKSLRDLMSQYPQGITLSEARRFCPLLLNPELLKNHASVRQLLASMPDVVRLWGLGVQTCLFPAVIKL